MTLQQLRYVVTIADCGSFNEAAKQLFVSQPSLSNAIKELEKDLGITIFLRSNKGARLSGDGIKFLSYARQIVEQSDYLEGLYTNMPQHKQYFSVSTQHYIFALRAFVNTIRAFPAEEYDLHLRETRTYDILDDVGNHRSELGVLFLNSTNESFLTKMFMQNHLEFIPLCTVTPHVYISCKHPLAGEKSLSVSQMQDYPVVTFDQGLYNSLHFSEEAMLVDAHKKHIHINDRASLLDFLVDLNAYTISSGFVDEHFMHKHICAIPLETDRIFTLGYICLKGVQLSRMGEEYVCNLCKELSSQKHVHMLK